MPHMRVLSFLLFQLSLALCFRSSRHLLVNQPAAETSQTLDPCSLTPLGNSEDQMFFHGKHGIHKEKLYPGITTLTKCILASSAQIGVEIIRPLLANT